MRTRPTLRIGMREPFIFAPSLFIPRRLLGLAAGDVLGRERARSLLGGARVVAVGEPREGFRGDDGAAKHLERELDAVGHLRASRYLRQVYAELHHRLRYCRRDAR